MTTLPDWLASDYIAAQPALDEWINLYALPADLAYGLVAWESKFRATAFLMDRNGGSVGLTQISLPTAQGLGYQGTLQGLYDRDTNAQFGLLYLRHQLDRYNGDYSQALSAYNAGTATSSNLQSYVANVLPRVAYFTQLFAEQSAVPPDDGSAPPDDTVDTSDTGDTSGGGVDPVLAVGVGLLGLGILAYALAKAVS